MSLFGLRVVESRYAVTRETETVHGVYPDWRERQARNFGRPSTGKWEPIEGDWDVTVEKPAIFVVGGGTGGTAFMHPTLMGVLRDIAL